MTYLSVSEIAKKWEMSERSVRNYCAEGRIDGAILVGKTWTIPEDAVKPDRKKKVTNAPKSLLGILREEKKAGLTGGIYHKIQIELTYNSNHIEGSRLTHDQTRYIYETNTIGVADGVVNVDDVVETANHFRGLIIALLKRLVSRGCLSLDGRKNRIGSGRRDKPRRCGKHQADENTKQNIGLLPTE